MPSPPHRPSTVLSAARSPVVCAWTAGALGTAWLLVEIFVRGRWDPSVGIDGALLLGGLVVGTHATAAFVASLLVAFVSHRRLATWRTPRHVAVGLAAGVLATVPLAAGWLSSAARSLEAGVGGDRFLWFVLAALALDALLFALLLRAFRPHSREHGRA